MKSDNGFFLMVESGRIDHAHHDNTANRAIEEVVQLDHAVEKALDMLKDELDETLIITTADHSHMMSMSGYSERGADITGNNSPLFLSTGPVKYFELPLFRVE